MRAGAPFPQSSSQGPRIVQRTRQGMRAPREAAAHVVKPMQLHLGRESGHAPVMPPLLRFARSHPFVALSFALGAAINIYGFASDAYELWTANLMPWVWQAFGAAVFFVAVARMIYVFWLLHEQTSSPTIGSATTSIATSEVEKPLELVAGQHFSRCHVELGGKRFKLCTFDNVTFVVGPDGFAMEDCEIRPFNVATSTPGIWGLLQMLTGAGSLKIPIMQEGGKPLSPEEFNARSGNRQVELSSPQSATPSPSSPPSSGSETPP